METTTTTVLDEKNARVYLDRLLQANDVKGAISFAKRVQRSLPKLKGIFQFLANIVVQASGEDEEIDWYSVFGVQPSADINTIKGHYVELAKLNRFGSYEAYNIIEKAWDTLSNKFTRNDYDRRRSLRATQSNQLMPPANNNYLQVSFDVNCRKRLRSQRIRRRGFADNVEPSVRNEITRNSAKKSTRIVPYIPTEDPARQLQQMNSLLSALRAKKLEMSNDLTYLSGMAPKSANQSKFESPGVQIMSGEDKSTLQQCKEMYKRNEHPPLMVVFDSREGYTVEADDPIKSMTFITEYTGDVYFEKDLEGNDCDSTMILLQTKRPSENLIICPDKRGNIARFISGINNHKARCKKKLNVQSVRYSVNGECRVILVATRDIAKGERLYYDYNGAKDLYPTHNFC